MLAIAHRFRLLPAVACLIVAAGCERKAPAPAPVGVWPVVSHGSFRIKMPGTPKRSDQSVTIPDGTLQVAFYALEEETRTYSFGTTTYPPATLRRVGVEKALEGGRDGQVASLPGQKLLSTRRIDYRGYPTIEFSYEATARNERTKEETRILNYSRTILVGDQSIIIILSGLSETVNQKMATDFFDTLEIDAPSASTPKRTAP